MRIVSERSTLVEIHVMESLTITPIGGNSSLTLSLATQYRRILEHGYSSQQHTLIFNVSVLYFCTEYLDANGCMRVANVMLMSPDELISHSINLLLRQVNTSLRDGFNFY